MNEVILGYVKKEIDKSHTSSYDISTLTPTLEDIKEMVSQVNKPFVKTLIRYYNRGVTPTDEVLDTIINMWAFSKFPLYVLFGRKIKLEQQYDFEISKNRFERELSNIFELGCVERNRKEGKVQVDISHFIYYKPIIDLFGTDILKENVCPEDKFFSTIFKNYKKGQKISRFFSRFFNDKDFDIEYSKILQQKANKESIIYSIAIEDYLTCSINDNNWGSCFRAEGLHASAVLELCYDRSTINCYVTHKDMDFRGFTWNSKIIRSFVYFNYKNCSFGIARCYPNFTNYSFYIGAKEGLQKIISSYFNIDTWYTCETAKCMTETSCNGEYELLEDLRRVHKDPNKRYCTSESLMLFLDPIKWFTSPEEVVHSDVIVGCKESVCTKCGKLVSEFYNRKFLCGDCEE